MALEILKQERETSQSLVRRFQKRIQQSGLLLRARKIRFRQRRKSEQMKKRAALRREELKKEYEKLKKLGKITEWQR
jgi:23S rRNA U2552 (ribose-2'-O)-methylase RlmE/FtsJ